MNNFDSIDQLWFYAVRTILRFGKRVESRNGGSFETLGYSATLSSLNQVFLSNPRRNLSPHYAGAETLWYLSGDDDASLVKLYAPSYSKYLNSDGRAHGAYGKRWADHHQFAKVIEELLKHPESRRAVLTCWKVDADLGNDASPDLPCTVAMQLIRRDDKLHAITFMRSNDAWLGLPYDIFALSSVQRLIAGNLGIEAGTYTHHVGSLHLYDQHFQAAEEAVRVAPEYGPSTNWGRNSTDQIRAALELEDSARNCIYSTETWCDYVTSCFSPRGLLGALTGMAGSKWMRNRAPLVGDGGALRSSLVDGLTDVMGEDMARLCADFNPDRNKC